jgi:nickel-dependent lactate racemase
MAHYELPYHKKTIDLDIPEKNVLYYRNITSMESETDNLKKLREALRINPLEKHIQGRRVCLIVEDATREVPLKDLLDATARPLQSASEINVIIATGTHEGENKGNYEIVESVKKTAVKNNWHIKNVTIHNCHSGNFLYMGQTKKYKNKIYANPEIENAEVFVTYSDMKNHYFAGYSNPLKNFLPGVCAYETVERNHALALLDASTFGHHPLHPDEKRRDNPLALDIWEGYKLIVGRRPVYVLTTITQKNQILWSSAGLLTDMLPQGIRMVDQLMSINIKKADYLIVSCGGYPNDESLYSAQRGLELSKNAVKKGGEILFLAACANGIGPQRSIENFYLPLKKRIDKILRCDVNEYKMYLHKTYKFARLIKQTKMIYVKSTLENKQISDIHLAPVDNAQKVVDFWLSQRKDCTINILTQGNKVAVHV